MLTNIEMVHLQKWTVLFFYILLLSIVSLQEHEKNAYLVYVLPLIVANNAYKSFRLTKSVAFLVLQLRKLFFIILPLPFMKWVG